MVHMVQPRLRSCRCQPGGTPYPEGSRSCSSRPTTRGRTRSRFGLTRQVAVDVRQISIGKGGHNGQVLLFPAQLSRTSKRPTFLASRGGVCRSKVKKVTMEALTLAPLTMLLRGLCPGTVEGRHLADSLCIANQGAKRQLPGFWRHHQVLDVFHLGGRDLDGLVLGHEERSSKPQTEVEARYHLRGIAPVSRRVICKILARRITGFALAMARRTPVLAPPLGSRAPSGSKPEARGIATRIGATSAGACSCRSNFSRQQYCDSPTRRSSMERIHNE